ncbi:MAG: SpoIIE family protein phosphatase [Clostridia bacterium]
MKTRRLNIRSKFIVLFIVLAVLLSTGSGLLAYALNYEQIVEQYGDMALNTATLASYEVKADKINDYLTLGKDKSYADSEKWLKIIKRTFKLKFLYVYVPVMDENDTIYVFDIATMPEEEGQICELGEHTGEGNVYDVVSGVMATGKPAANAAISHSEYGYLISGFVPIKTAEGVTTAVMGVDIDMSIVHADIWHQTFKISGFTALIILVFVMIVLLVVNHQMVCPINELSDHMAAFDKNAGTLKIEKLEVHTGDEIELMANNFNQMAIDLKLYVENLQSITAEKERIATELGVATRIQASMLPSIFSFIPERPEFEIFATMQPAKEVGGDFYDFFLVDKSHLAFVIADVSGKGVPAALFMVIAKTLIKNHALLGESPAQVFTNVNNQLCENNEASMFVTAFMGIIDLTCGKLTFANAGHNQPLLYHKDGGYEWFTERGGLVLACMEKIEYKNFTRNLSQNDRLFLYTDGVTEALNEKQELFSDPRLLETLQRSIDKSLCITDLLRFIKTILDDYAGDAEQADDITMMSVDWFGPKKR